MLFFSPQFHSLKDLSASSKLKQLRGSRNVKSNSTLVPGEKRKCIFIKVTHGREGGPTNQPKIALQALTCQSLQFSCAMPVICSNSPHLWASSVSHCPFTVTSGGSDAPAKCHLFFSIRSLMEGERKYESIFDKNGYWQTTPRSFFFLPRASIWQVIATFPKHLRQTYLQL